MSNKVKIIIVIVCVLCVAVAVTLGTVFGIEAHKKRVWNAAKYYSDKVELFRTENATIAKGGIVFVGDSITDICDLDKFYPGLGATNRGIGGDTTEGLLKRMSESIYDLEPSLVVLLIGINDLSVGKTVEEVVRNIKLIVSEIHRVCPYTEVIVESIYPVNSDWSKDMRDHHTPMLMEVNRQISSSAEAYDYTYADVHSVLVDGEGYLIREYADDGLHPNDTGYRAIVAYLRPIIEGVSEGE